MGHLRGQQALHTVHYLAEKLVYTDLQACRGLLHRALLLFFVIYHILTRKSAQFLIHFYPAHF